MSEKRRALGRGLGALIPGSPTGGGLRPVDVFFHDDGTRSGSLLRDSGLSNGDDGPSGTQPSPAGDGVILVAERNAVRVDGDDAVGMDNVDEISQLAPVTGARFAHVPVGAIQPNRHQPRTQFDEDELAELAQSISMIGVLQPVVVRELTGARGLLADGSVDGPPFADEPGLSTADLPPGEPNSSGTSVRYELVMGERRWRATILAGLDTIPAIIRETQDDALLRDALLENLHRSQLNPLEEAAAYQQLLDDFGGTHDELAARLGRSRPQISNTIRLLRLPPLVARRVAAGVLTAGHARALLALDDAAAMERLAQRIVAEGLSVRSVEEIVTLGDDVGGTPRRARRTPDPRPDLEQLAAELSDRFDTRVRIAMGQRKGRLSVEFASVEDLRRIVALLSTPEAPGRHAAADDGHPSLAYQL